MASLTSLYRQHFYVTCVTVTATGIATLQTRSGAGVLVLDGALSSGGVYTAADGTVDSAGNTVKVGHKISLTSTVDLSGLTFTVVGIDSDGYAVTETITGPNNATVKSTNYFYKVTSVSSSGTVTTGVSVGISNELATQRVLIEPRTSGFSPGMGVHVSGTVSLTAQVSMSDPYSSNVIPSYIADTTLATKTAAFYSQLGVTVAAVRCVTNSYSTGATFEFHVIQNK